MDDRLKKSFLIFITLGFIILAVLTLSLYLGGHLNFREITLRPAEQPDQAALNSREAYFLALPKARAWQADAGLARIDSVVGATGGWTLLFVSEKKPGSGLRLDIADRQVGNLQEIPFFGGGGELTGELLSADEAVARARQISGYENEPIIAVEMIYDKTVKRWFWGIKTARGVISIAADK